MTARRIVVAVLALAASVTVGIYAQGGGRAADARVAPGGRLVHLSPATSSPARGARRR